MEPKPFSDQLEAWLHSHKPKTIAGLVEASAEKSFAMVFLVLMAIPALPLPTGGVTHVFEIIVMLLALELVIGRTTIWLPKKWFNRPLGKTLQNRTLPYLIRKIRWLEKYSRPRWGGLLNNHQYLRLVGLLVIAFTLAAFLAPPFSGLDTMPSIAVVGIALSLILEDFVFFIASVIIGLAAIMMNIFLGAAIIELFKRLGLKL